MGKLLGSGPLCDSECKNIHCCTSTQRVVDPRWLPYPERARQISDSTASEKSTGRSFFRRKRKMSCTIYVDSRKRTAGDDSSFEYDLGETLHLQTGAKLSVFKLRVADAFLSTDRGFYMYWRDTALGTLNWAVLPVGAYTGARLAAWISSNYASATYTSTRPTRSAWLTMGIAACSRMPSSGSSSPTPRATLQAPRPTGRSA